MCLFPRRLNLTRWGCKVERTMDRGGTWRSAHHDERYPSRRKGVGSELPRMPGDPDLISSDDEDGERARMPETAEEAMAQVPRSVSVYLGPPIWRARALFRCKIYKFLSETQNVYLRMIGQSE